MNRNTTTTTTETENSDRWRLLTKSGYFRHGGPYDRGSADFYYWRECVPHYYVGATYQTERVSYADMMKPQRDAYYAGWKDAEADNNRKEWR